MTLNEYDDSAAPPVLDDEPVRPAGNGYRSRAQRLADPRMSEIMLEVARDYGVCVRPVALRRVDVDTCQAVIIDVPCSATLASKCPSCAERRRRLRMADCRIGWHLDTEPVLEPDPPSPEQQWLAAFRADVQLERDHAETAGDTGRVRDLDDVLADLDEQLRALGVRGRLDPVAPMSRSPAHPAVVVVSGQWAGGVFFAACPHGRRWPGVQDPRAKRRGRNITGRAQRPAGTAGDVVGLSWGVGAARVKLQARLEGAGRGRRPLVARREAVGPRPALSPAPV